MGRFRAERSFLLVAKVIKLLGEVISSSKIEIDILIVDDYSETIQSKRSNINLTALWLHQETRRRS